MFSSSLKRFIILTISSTFIGAIMVQGSDNGAIKKDNLSSKQTSLSSQVTESAIGKTLYWISPQFNMDIFTYILPFMFIPIALIYVYIIYPPRRYYVTAPNSYMGYYLSNDTRRSWWKCFRAYLSLNSILFICNKTGPVLLLDVVHKISVSSANVLIFLVTNRKPNPLNKLQFYFHSSIVWWDGRISFYLMHLNIFGDASTLTIEIVRFMFAFQITPNSTCKDAKVFAVSIILVTALWLIILSLFKHLLMVLTSTGH